MQRRSQKLEITLDVQAVSTYHGTPLELLPKLLEWTSRFHESMDTYFTFWFAFLMNWQFWLLLEWVIRFKLSLNSTLYANLPCHGLMVHQSFIWSKIPNSRHVAWFLTYSRWKSGYLPHRCSGTSMLGKLTEQGWQWGGISKLHNCAVRQLHVIVCFLDNDTWCSVCISNKCTSNWIEYILYHIFTSQEEVDHGQFQEKGREVYRQLLYFTSQLQCPDTAYGWKIWFWSFYLMIL